MNATAAVCRIVAELPPVSLDVLLAKAELQRRVDTKFIVFPAVLQRLVAALDGELEVLEIDGRRQFAYDSVYFDSPTFRTYRDHLKGRRRRFKARTREYVDTGTCMFEIKLEQGRGGTAKVRVPHPVGSARQLTAGASGLLRSVLADAGIDAGEDLVPSLRTAYRRTTLVGRQREFRLTVDTELHWSGAGRQRSALGDRVLLEVKTPGARDPLLDLARTLGMRPVSVSKYCAGVALLHPEIPSNPWRPVLRDHFGAAA